MTAQRLDRQMTPVDVPPRGRTVRSGTDVSGHWPTGVRRWLIHAGSAAAHGIPAAVLAVTVRTAAQPMVIIVAALAAFIVACAAAAVMYQVRQEIRRRQLELQAVNGIAGAFTACLNDVHRHAGDPADKASVAEAARVRDSARQFLAEHRDDLARLSERPDIDTRAARSVAVTPH